MLTLPGQVHLFLGPAPPPVAHSGSLGPSLVSRGALHAPHSHQHPRVASSSADVRSQSLSAGPSRRCLHGEASLGSMKAKTNSFAFFIKV